MTNPLNTPEVETTRPGADAGSPAESSAIGTAGQALSSPAEARLTPVLSPAGDATLAKFPGDHNLLAQINSPDGKEAPAIDPVFPLPGPYDPEKAYTGGDGKPTQRGVALQKEAQDLVAKQAKLDGSLSLPDHGKIMETISKQAGLSEADKWYLYRQVCKEESNGRDADGRLIPGTHAHRVLFDTNKPTGLPESGKGEVVRHVIINPTNDGYHGGLVYGSSSWRSGYQTGESGIHFHEHVEKPLVNFFRGQGFSSDAGDEQASDRQLAALRAMQTGGFDAYSRVWNENFAK